MVQSYVHVFFMAVTLVFLSSASAVPKKTETGYFQQSGDQLAMESTGQRPGDLAAAASESSASASPRSADQAPAGSEQGRPQEPRFGFIGYPATGVQDPNYGNAATYGALRLDLGGVLLGAIIGLGASLVIPKLLHGVGNSHDHYRRADDDSAISGLTDAASRVQRALQERDVDPAICAQRAVCQMAQSATAEGTPLAKAAELARSSLVSFMLEGSAMKKAVDAGLKGGNCAKLYHKCPFTQDTLAAGLQGLIAPTR